MAYTIEDTAGKKGCMMVTCVDATREWSNRVVKKNTTYWYIFALKGAAADRCY